MIFSWKFEGAENQTWVEIGCRGVGNIIDMTRMKYFEANRVYSAEFCRKVSKNYINRDKLRKKLDFQSFLSPQATPIKVPHQQLPVQYISIVNTLISWPHLSSKQNFHSNSLYIKIKFNMF